MSCSVKRQLYVCCGKLSLLPQAARYLTLNAIPKADLQGSGLPSTSSSFIDELQARYGERLLRFDQKLQKAASDHFYIAPETRNYRRNIVQALRRALVGKSNRSLVQVGSSASGLASEKSDIDLVLLTSGDANIRKKMVQQFKEQQALKKYMYRLIRQLKDSELANEFDWSATACLSHARIPILVFTSRAGLKLEMQFDGEQAIRNTLSLRHIVMSDPRIPVLIFWAGEWLKALQLKNSKQNLFSSYHVALLAIHFLQQRMKLPSEDSCTEMDPLTPLEEVISSLASKEPCTRKMRRNLQPTVTELMLYFLDYYSGLDLHKVVIPANDLHVRKRKDEEKDGYLWITDQFSEKNVCTVSRGADRFAEAISFTKAAMISGKGLDWPIKLKR